MFLKELIKEEKIIKTVNLTETEIENIWVSGLADDSRLVREGDVFFCRQGARFDTHSFADEAVRRGAVAVVCERELPLPIPQVVVEDGREGMATMAGRFYGNPSKRLRVIGITGTNGKTTVSYMLASILRTAGKRVGVIGTLGIYYGKKKIAPELTTPDPIYLQKTLADMVQAGVEYVVVEISAHALYYKKDAPIEYSACIFTNFTQDHLDFFPSMEEYGNAKKRLFDVGRCKVCILNGDDAFGREIGFGRQNIHAGVQECRRQTPDLGVQAGGRPNGVLYYGIETPCDAFAMVEREMVHGSLFIVNLMDDIGRISLPMMGRHNVYNALAAATCARALGISMQSIESGLNGLPPVKGRLELVGEYNGAKIFVDFAHTPDGLEKSLQELRKHTEGRLICLFGCGGNRDKLKRPLMGETVGRRADFAVLTSDNPRYEDPMDIISAIEKGLRPVSHQYAIVPDREEGIAYAMGLLQKGDVLLVAGKGGECYQEIMGIKYLLSDDDIIKSLIGRAGR